MKVDQHAHDVHGKYCDVCALAVKFPAVLVYTPYTCVFTFKIFASACRAWMPQMMYTLLARDSLGRSDAVDTAYGAAIASAS